MKRYAWAALPLLLLPTILHQDIGPPIGRPLRVTASKTVIYPGQSIDDQVDAAIRKDDQNAADKAQAVADGVAAQKQADDAVIATLQAKRATVGPLTVPGTRAATASGWVPSFAWWSRVAVCEEGGWGTHTHAANWLATFVGDLGIMEAAWNENAPPGYPPGWLATPEQQVVVADAIYAVTGPGAWTSGSCTGAPF